MTPDASDTRSVGRRATGRLTEAAGPDLAAVGSVNVCAVRSSLALASGDATLSGQGANGLIDASERARAPMGGAGGWQGGRGRIQMGARTETRRPTLPTETRISARRPHLRAITLSGTTAPASFKHLNMKINK